MLLLHRAQENSQDNALPGLWIQFLEIAQCSEVVINEKIAPLNLPPGNNIEIEITDLGTLLNHVVGEK